MYAKKRIIYMLHQCVYVTTRFTTTVCFNYSAINKKRILANFVIFFSGAKVIDATEKFIIPGGIDPCTNFRGEDLADDLNSGTRAALAGGTTTIMELVIPDKDQSLIDAVNAWKEDIEELGKKN